MEIEYGSVAYCLYLALALALVLGCFFLFRRRSVRAKRTAVFVLMIVNAAQHLLKSVLYPHLYGTGFGLVNTAYNVCAFLILASPIVLLFGSDLVKAFLSYTGAVGSLLALAVPFWFIGQTVRQWEFLRFYVCHVLLLLTSALPVLWKLHTPRYRDFWKAGFLFLGMLCAILLNDIFFFICDAHGNPQALFDSLQAQNPFWAMHPTELYPALANVFSKLTPSVFLPSEAHPYYTPVLWYAFPIYLIVTALALVLYFAADMKRFISDCRTALNRKNKGAL